jgi:hypothetical protein
VWDIGRAMEQVVKYDRPAHVPVTKVSSDWNGAAAIASCRALMFQEARMPCHGHGGGYRW